MGHEITVRENGFAEAAFAMKPAWHGLGRIYDKPMTSAEALEGAGLDWRVEQEATYIREGDSYRELPEHVVNVRSDNRRVLGIVSDHYKVVQNTEAFEFVDRLVDEEQMLYESAFSLRGGKNVVLLARMPGVREVVEGDQLLDYVLLSMAHDGTGAITFGPTSVRVVCANTYQLALGSDKGQKIKSMSIRHQGNVMNKLSRARQILGMAKYEFDQHNAVAKELADRVITREEWVHFLDIMCPELDPLDPDYTDRRAEKIADTRLAIKAAYHNERQALAANTAWAAYNAVSEHIDHLPRRGGSKRRKAEARFNVCLYGAGRDMKQRAFEAACNLAGISA